MFLGIQSITRTSLQSPAAFALVLFLILVACAHSQPAGEAVDTTRMSSTALSTTNLTPSIMVSTALASCSSGIITPEDAHCYLATTDPSQVQRIDDETAVLFADPQSIDDWAGAAIVFHTPTESTLVLDQFGDVDPKASNFSSRAGLAALSELAGKSELMAGLKQQVQLKWKTTALNVPEIRPGTALYTIGWGQSSSDEDGETWQLKINSGELVQES